MSRHSGPSSLLASNCPATARAYNRTGSPPTIVPRTQTQEPDDTGSYGERICEGRHTARTQQAPPSSASRFVDDGSSDPKPDALSVFGLWCATTSARVLPLRVVRT